MSTSVISDIEKSIFELPESEQLRLIARVAETLRRKQETEDEGELFEMANDPDIQRELLEIEKDFAVAEFDGLAE